MNDATIFSCHHPPAARWVSDCGHVEVCALCSEPRRTTSRTRFWRPSQRLQRVVDGELLTFDATGERLFRREAVVHLAVAA